MWVETKLRVIEILKTLTRPTGTYYIVADNVPLDRADHHQYLIVVKSTRDTVQTPVTSQMRTHVMNFAIEVTSQQVLTGLPIVNETTLESYADAITALLERYPRLESIRTDADPGRIGLAGVQSTLVGGAQFQTPTPYASTQHYGVTVPLQVTFDRQTGC
jgi:hypothetical protein